MSDAQEALTSPAKLFREAIALVAQEPVGSLRTDAASDTAALGDSSRDSSPVGPMLNRAKAITFSSSPAPALPERRSAHRSALERRVDCQQAAEPDPGANSLSLASLKDVVCLLEKQAERISVVEGRLEKLAGREEELVLPAGIEEEEEEPWQQRVERRFQDHERQMADADERMMKLERGAKAVQKTSAGMHAVMKVLTEVQDHVSSMGAKMDTAQGTLDEKTAQVQVLEEAVAALADDLEQQRGVWQRCSGVEQRCDEMSQRLSDVEGKIRVQLARFVDAFQSILGVLDLPAPSSTRLDERIQGLMQRLSLTDPQPEHSLPEDLAAQEHSARLLSAVLQQHTPPMPPKGARVPPKREAENSSRGCSPLWRRSPARPCDAEGLSPQHSFESCPPEQPEVATTHAYRVAAQGHGERLRPETVYVPASRRHSAVSLPPGEGAEPAAGPQSLPRSPAPESRTPREPALSPSASQASLMSSQGVVPKSPLSPRPVLEAGSATTASTTRSPRQSFSAEPGQAGSVARAGGGRGHAGSAARSPARALQPDPGMPAGLWSPGEASLGAPEARATSPPPAAPQAVSRQASAPVLAMAPPSPKARRVLASPCSRSRATLAEQPAAQAGQRQAPSPLHSLVTRGAPGPGCRGIRSTWNAASKDGAPRSCRSSVTGGQRDVAKALGGGAELRRQDRQARASPRSSVLGSSRSADRLLDG